ncbi:hypothetical protein COLO4_37254 [Corchorus olitorius]|uniref:APO domain-containing protein n=1 Tax=Corchorus olitorius TaxID=93759 RepID=A0A1R3G2X5_9ROSI|nr:hypothetical protein COLO4_37254 [Corchorus olitorius]
MKELIKRAKQEKELRKAQPCRLLEHPPDNGLLVPELVEVAHRVHRAREFLLSGLSKLVRVIPVHLCRFCSEVHIGNVGNEIRTCTGPNSGFRSATHVWIKGGVTDVFFSKCFHLYDRVGKPRVVHDERHSVKQIPAILELCIQAGVDVEKYPSKRRTKPVYSIEGRIVDFESAAVMDEMESKLFPQNLEVGILTSDSVGFEMLTDSHLELHDEEKNLKELSTRTMVSWFEMIAGVKKIMEKYTVWTCGYCPEIQATIDDIVGPNYVWHVRDLNGPPLRNELKRYYGKAPVLVELCIQAGAPVPDQYTNLYSNSIHFEYQLEQAEKRLQDSESKLARLRGQHNASSSSGSQANGIRNVKVERRSISPERVNGSSKNQPQPRTELVIPSVSPKTSQPVKTGGSGANTAAICGPEASAASNKAVKVKKEKSHRTSADAEVVESKDRGTKRKFVRWTDLSTCGKFRLEDARESQISVLDLNKTKGRARVTFLEDKPHVKGIINSIMFMPWENTCFVTGGSDHAVVLWNERDNNVWKPKHLHRNMHSSAVMGVAGMQQKQVVLSAGADKRIIGFDVHVGRADYKHQIDSKCMSVLANPCDFNLFMVHAGAHERQLRLYDIRIRQTEVHSFGWTQQSSESQSALINQAWSPDGLYLTSGSADPIIHIFDIRYNAQKPAQSIRAHQKRVFKAVWHNSLPLLISISSDLQVGLHKM